MPVQICMQIVECHRSCHQKWDHSPHHMRRLPLTSYTRNCLDCTSPGQTSACHARRSSETRVILTETILGVGTTGVRGLHKLAALPGTSPVCLMGGLGTPHSGWRTRCSAGSCSSGCCTGRRQAELGHRHWPTLLGAPFVQHWPHPRLGTRSHQRTDDHDPGLCPSRLVPVEPMLMHCQDPIRKDKQALMTIQHNTTCCLGSTLPLLQEYHNETLLSMSP